MRYITQQDNSHTFTRSLKIISTILYVTKSRATHSEFINTVLREYTELRLQFAHVIDIFRLEHLDKSVFRPSQHILTHPMIQCTSMLHCIGYLLASGWSVETRKRLCAKLLGHQCYGWLPMMFKYRAWFDPTYIQPVAYVIARRRIDQVVDIRIITYRFDSFRTYASYIRFDLGLALAYYPCVIQQLRQKKKRKLVQTSSSTSSDASDNSPATKRFKT